MNNNDNSNNSDDDSINNNDKDKNNFWIFSRYFWKEWTNQFLISWFFFGIRINFLEQKFVQMKAENSDINHLRQKCEDKNMSCFRN